MSGIQVMFSLIDFIFLHLSEVVLLINSFWPLSLFYFIVIVNLIISLMLVIRKK